MNDSRTAPRFVCVAMHDVSPATWPDCERLLTALAEVAAFPVTLLVVPDYHHGTPARQDPAFVAAMTARLARGDELALHGLHHWDDQRVQGFVDYVVRRVYTASEGEFAALSLAQARERLLTGTRWFRENDWPLHGFVAPAWLMSDGTLNALAECRLAYTTTLRRIIVLPENHSIIAPCLAYSTRAAWRRTLSGFWNDWVQIVSYSRPTIRLALHPNDAHSPSVISHWQRILERCLKTRHAVTKAALVEHMRHRYLSRRHIPVSIA